MGRISATVRTQTPVDDGAKPVCAILMDRLALSIPLACPIHCTVYRSPFQGLALEHQGMHELDHFESYIYARLQTS